MYDRTTKSYYCPHCGKDINENDVCLCDESEEIIQIIPTKNNSFVWINTNNKLTYREVEFWGLKRNGETVGLIVDAYGSGGLIPYSEVNDDFVSFTTGVCPDIKFEEVQELLDNKS